MSSAWTEVVRRGRGSGGRAKALPAPATTQGTKKRGRLKGAGVRLANQHARAPLPHRHQEDEVTPSKDGRGGADCVVGGRHVHGGESDGRGQEQDQARGLRVTGLDDSVTRAEVIGALAREGGCAEGDVKAGEIRRSPPDWALFGATKKAADKGRILVGWVAARVEILAPRLLQCYRCLEQGHTRQRCTAVVDRSDRCYWYGVSGHQAAKWPANSSARYVRHR